MTPFNERRFSMSPTESLYSMDHLDWRNLVDPPKGLPVPPLPEVWLRHCSNPLLALGEPKYALDVLKRIPFIVSISYTMDEVTDFADIVLPDKLELESYIPYFGTKPACQRKYFVMAWHQTIVEAPPNVWDYSDILTELADRAGFLDEYNKELNEALGFSDSSPHKLEPGKKYSWEEVVDRKCKFCTNGTYDLEWFKKHYILIKPVSVQEEYDIHFNMKAKKLRYPVPYMEVVKRSGD